MNSSAPSLFPNEFARFQRVRRSMLWIFLLAIGLRLAVFWVGMAHTDEHGNNPAFFWYDSGQYLNPTESLLRYGTYTIDSGGRQVPYFTRPAGYPWFVVACYKIGGERTSSILLPQIVMGALACSFVYWIAAMLFTHRIGLFAGLLMTLDQTWIAYANKVMTETFSVFSLTASTLCLLLFLAHRKQALLWLSGILLGLCTLAHSSTLYYWVVPATCLAVWAGVSLKEKIRWIVVFAAAFFLTTGVWQARNFLVFHVYQISPKGTVIATTATRVLWREQPKRTWDEVADEYYDQFADRFSEKYGLTRQQWKDWVDPEIRRRYFSSYLDYMNEEAVRVFREHFHTYFGMVRYSFLRITVLPLPYAELCRFTNPQKLDTEQEDLRGKMTQALEGLAHGRVGQFWQTTRELPFCKLVGFGWNALYWLLTVPAALVGAYLIIRRWPFAYLILLLGSIAYFSVTSPLTMAGDGMQRYRLRLLPYLYCVAAVGWLGRKNTEKREQDNAASKGILSRLMAAMHAPVYAARLAELVRCITPHLREHDKVLDVGCGFGALGKALLESNACPKGVRIEGLERVKRGGEAIPVTEYDGKTIPLGDRTYDVVILADVLHHDPDPDRLLSECIRVSRRLVIIKDHQRKGFLAQWRISFLDWAANAPYGVSCLYRYNRPKEWTELVRRHGLEIVEQRQSMNLYPPVVNLVFGRKLHYFAVLRVRSADEGK